MNYKEILMEEASRGFTIYTDATTRLGGKSLYLTQGTVFIAKGKQGDFVGTVNLLISPGQYESHFVQLGETIQQALRKCPVGYESRHFCIAGDIECRTNGDKLLLEMPTFAEG